MLNGCVTRKSSPRGLDSSHVFRPTGRPHCRWGPISLGESVVCLAGHKTRLESGPRGLDAPSLITVLYKM